MVSVIRSLLVLFVLVLPTGLSASPSDTVKTYHDRLLQSIASTTGKSDQARFTSLAPAMDAAFDFESMIKTAVGMHWTAASPATRQTLIDAFRRVSIATYADQFSKMTEGEFIVRGTRAGPRGLKLVDCQLKTGDDAVALTYVVRNKDGNWLIIDVLLKGGISELAMRASEYASTLKAGGPKALIETLDERATALLVD